MFPLVKLRFLGIIAKHGKIIFANCKNKLATPWHDTVRRTVTFDELS